MAAAAAVEAGHLVAAPAHHRHAARLERLERAADVEDGLGPGADDGHRRAGQLTQVGADVHRRLPSPVDAADAARWRRRRCRPGARRSSWPRRWCRPSPAVPARRPGSAARPWGCHAHRPAPPARSSVRPTSDAAVVDRHRGRHGAGVADGRLRHACGREVVGARQAVGGDGRFEGHHGAARDERGLDLWMDGEQIGGGHAA